MLDPGAAVMRTLESFGPSGSSRAVTYEESIAYCRGLAAAHYENFPVLTRLVPKPLRDPFAAVYAYCRWSDDLADDPVRELGDEAGRARSLELLLWWRGELDRCAAGHAAHPVFVALRPVLVERGLSPVPFHRLLDAFEQDQRVTRYRSWDELLGYCRGSADPVGRIVLALGGVGDGDDAAGFDEMYRMSDATCTALQLANFWQDARRDLIDRDRVYMPQDETGLSAEDLRTMLDAPDDEGRERFACALEPLMVRTESLFAQGRSLPRAMRSTPATPLAPVVWAFGAAGRSLCASIRRGNCMTLWERSVVSKRTKASLVLRAAVARWLGRVPA